jgi:hypothetical protein
MTQGTVRVQKNFLALAAQQFEVRDEFLETAWRYGKQQPIAGRI